MSAYPRTRAALAHYDRRQAARDEAQRRVKRQLTLGDESCEGVVKSWLDMLAAELRAAFAADTGDPEGLSAPVSLIREVLKGGAS